MITTVMLAVLSLASCKQPLHERQIETVGELMDSLINRGEQVYRYIICGGDSTYQDERWFYYFYDEKNKNVQQSSLLFLADKMPDLLDKLCREAEKSYRYWEGDSLDYSITMHSKPLELLSFKHYKSEKDEEVVSLNHTTMACPSPTSTVETSSSAACGKVRALILWPQQRLRAPSMTLPSRKKAVPTRRIRTLTDA